MVDIIAHEEVFEVNSNVHQFNPKKLAKRLRHIDEYYCARFAKKYNLEIMNKKHIISTIIKF